MSNSPEQTIMGEMSTPDNNTSDYLFNDDPGRKLSPRELAINHCLSMIVELWIEDDTDEATAIMKQVERYHKMSDKRFDEVYKDE